MAFIEGVRKPWLNETKLGLIALIGNIIFIVYIGAIQMNDVKNMVLKHEQIIMKLEVKVAEMDNSKVGVRIEFLDFESINDNSSKLKMQMIYQTEEHRAEQLKLPFANGLNMAHDRLQIVLNNLTK